MLEIVDLHASYGGSLILQGINMSARRGEIVALLGRNGVGKTTLMRTIVGLMSPQSGKILLNGKNVAGMSPHEIAELGISYVPQGREIFQSFTVFENLKLGRIRFKRRDRGIPEYIFDYFPILHERRNQKAGLFSGGEQQMLAIARALVSNPKVLLLDEPSEGIQPSIIDEIGKILCKINKEKGVTILIVEQNVDLIMDMAKECFFMEKGLILDRAYLAELRNDDSLITRYLAL